MFVNFSNKEGERPFVMPFLGSFRRLGCEFYQFCSAGHWAGATDGLQSLVSKDVPQYSGSIQTCSDAVAAVSYLDPAYGAALRKLCPCACNNEMVSYAQSHYY
jgi:hypothetical protein